MKATFNSQLRGVGTLLLIVHCFFYSSCYTPRYVYSPSAHNVPLFAKKGDSKMGINYSSNLPGSKTINNQVFRGKSSGFDLHGAYAFHKKFAVQVNHFSRAEQNGGNYSTTRDSAIIRYRRKLTELGAGYYTKLNPESSLIFQLFAGIGIGNFSFTDRGKDVNQVAYTRYHKSGIFKFYVQPAFQYQNKKRIAAALSSRFSVINFGNIRTDYTPQEQANFELDRISSSPVLFWEPAFVNSFGFKKFPGFLLEYQAGLSLLMSRRFVDARSFNLSIGIQIDPPQLLKRKVQSSKKSPDNL